MVLSNKAKQIIINYKRRKGRSNPRRSLKRALGIYRPLFPKIQKCKLLYAENVSMNPGVGSMAYYDISVNSLYDPNYTGTGHQVKYFDDMMAIYYRYKVISSKITAQFMAATVSAIAPYYCGITKVATPADSLPATIGSAIENSNIHGFIATPYRQFGKGMAQLTHTFSAKDYFTTAKDLDLSGTATTSPNRQAYFRLLLQAIPQSLDGDPFEIVYKVEYNVEFYERKTQSED